MGKVHSIGFYWPGERTRSYIGEGFCTGKGSERTFYQEGIGSMDYGNGKIYQGGFKKGIADGPGRLKMPNGTNVYANWSNGEMHGWGYMEKRCGKVYTAKFNEGKQVSTPRSITYRVNFLDIKEKIMKMGSHLKGHKVLRTIVIQGR